MPLVELIALSHCRQGSGVFAERDGHELAVFLLGDPPRVCVIDNTCPHAGGNLSGGEVCGHIVTCPRHAWRFDLHTGRGVESPMATVRCYHAEIRDQGVWVELP